MAEKKTNDSERIVSCAFCIEQHSSSTIGQHLLMCGNKTDQCPKCRAFVRRAIFAYHYENDCANLDALDEPTNSSVDRPNASSTLHRNDLSHSQSGSPVDKTRNDKQILTITYNASSYPQTNIIISQRSNTEMQTTVVCPFCHHECDPADSKIHQKMCLRNPVNTAKKNPLFIHETVDQNSSRLNHVNASDETDNIPCEYCNEPIELRNYDAHTRACGQQDHDRTQRELKSANGEDNDRMYRCIYCNDQRTAAGIKIHEDNCPKVNRTANNAAYKRAFRLPDLQN